MSTKSCESIYGTTIRISAERAKEARKEADRLACEAWNYRVLRLCVVGFAGQPQGSQAFSVLLERLLCSLMLSHSFSRHPGNGSVVGSLRSPGTRRFAASNGTGYD
jgi:hypothetical protein